MCHPITIHNLFSKLSCTDRRSATAAEKAGKVDGGPGAVGGAYYLQSGS